MKGKKLTIIGIALSMSLALSTQTAMALELGDKTDLANNAQEQNDKSSKTFSVEKSVQKTLDIVKQPYKDLAPKVGSGNPTDATTGATYYRKANWENKIKDKSRWPIGDNQRLVRVSTSDPLEMNDVNYDGAFIDANGRTVLRLIYREKAQAVSAVWYRALFNFGDLDQYIDYDKSYVVGRDGETKYDLKPFNDRKERLLDIGRATGDRTNQRKNLPINLVLKEGLRTKDLGNRNYIVQMRITNGDDATKIYAYAPGKSSMDYSSYTKTTSVSLEDKVDSLFLKGGLQNDSENATNQEFFMSEFIANPENYADASNIGIIRTQYMGQRSGGDSSPTVGGEPIAFVQVFDAKLVDFFKVEKDGTIAYTNLLNDDRSVSKFAHKIKIKKSDINYSTDGKLAYIVLAPKAFQKEGVKKVEITDHDQYTMLKGIYITAIDYLVDKNAFAEKFTNTKKLDYSMMSGWMNPNLKGWTVFEKEYDNDYKVPEGESYLIDVGTKPASNQIMIQIGDETRAIYRKPQGYYNSYVTNKKGIDQIDEFAKGVYKFTLREGATIEKGQKIRILVPYVGDHPDTVNFLEASDGTDYNKGSAQLRLQKDRNINMHLYTDLPGGATFKLRYTLKGQTEEKELVFTKPNLAGGLWKYSDKDRVLTGIPNKSSTSTGGNFYIDTTKLEKGKDIFVDAYDEKGNKLEDKTSYFRYSKVNKVSVHKGMTWVDHADTSSILSINKSLYTPYQLLFTNDYAEGTDDFYKDPRVLPASNDDFKKDTKEFVGYTKYDGGKVRTLYEEGKTGKLYAKVEAAEDEYTDKGELKTDNSKKIAIPKDNIFDAQFAEDNKGYRAYEYKVDLTKMLPYHSDDKTEKPLTLLKDMKFVSNASDGSSLPSDLYETRVRARVLFDTTDGAWADGTKKVVKIAPDNVKFYGEEGYAANGFEGANVEADTGDKFPEAPKLEGKNFLGWVTEEGKKALKDKAVVAADAFAKLSKDQIFTNETPVTKHLVVYAIYSEDVAVTFDANEGKFVDGKDTTTVKAESGSVAKPADPTREGYTFKGWAATKDAKEADANILNNVTAAKTVYAVWEKNADSELALNNPAKTPVGDLNALTPGEKDAVIKAIIDANPGKDLTAADIKVENDGRAIVSKDGKTKEFKPEVTVEQKEVQNNFNPPKEPVLVDNTSALTPEEKQAVKDAVKEANKDRHLTDDDITVENDGTVKINQDGKTGTIPADKTVKAKDSVLKLTDPDVTEVKDINNLTEEEKDAVKKAVIAKNSGLTEKDITVDSKGNVSVKTSDGKTGEIPASKTVKEKDLSKLKNPAVTPVADDKNLTENEKQAVKDAIKAANKDYDLQDNEIAVDDNGKATVTRGDSTKVFEPAETVKKDAKLLDVKAPKKTEVANINKLTEPEQEAVEAAIIAANPDLQLTKEEVVINDDGSAVITRGDKKYALAQKDNVVEKLKYPEITEVANPTALTENEKADVERAVRNANPNLPEGTKIEVAANGEVTVTYPESDGRPAATIPAKNTVVKTETKDKTAPAAPTVEAKDDGSVTVTPPKDVDVKSMDITYTPEGSDKPVTVKATKDDYGNWTLPANSGLKIDPASGVVTIPADKVKDGTDVTAKAKDASDNESEAGTAKAKTPSGETDKTAPAAPTVKANDDGSLTVTPPKDADTKTVEVTYTDNNGNEKKVTATKGDDGKWSVPDGSDVTVDPDTGVITVPADKVKDGTDVTAKAKDGSNNESEAGTAKAKGNLKTDADKTDPKVPAKTKVADKANLTDDEKAAVKKAIEDANKDKFPEGTTVEVGNDGTATITYPDKSTDTIKGSDLVDQKTDAGKTTADKTDPSVPEKTKVADKANLTDTEKAAVKKAIEDANKDKFPEGTTVEVGNDGTATITYPDKSTDTIKGVDLVEQKSDAGKTDAEKTDPAVPAKTKVGNKGKLTDDEKAAVKKAIEDANKDKFPEGTKVEVGDDGTATITYPDKSTDTIKGSDLVDQKTDAGKTTADKTDPTVPAKTKVVDKANLTDTEKAAAKKAIEDANKDKFPQGTKVEVGNDGTATITYPDGSVDTIKGSDLVEQKTNAGNESEIKAPTTPVEVKDPSNLTDDEKAKVKDAVKKANPNLPANATITVANDGTVTVTVKDGKEIGKLTPDKTVKKAGAGSQGNVDKSKPSNQKGDKGVNTGDESRTGILATFFASIIALFAIKRRKKDAK